MMTAFEWYAELFDSYKHRRHSDDDEDEWYSIVSTEICTVYCRYQSSLLSSSASFEMIGSRVE